MNTIKLDNNCCLEIKKNNLENLNNVIDIKNLKLNKINKNTLNLLKIDLNTFELKDYKKILRHLLFIKTVVNKEKIGILQNSNKLLGYIINYDDNNKKHNDFISGINAIFYNTRYERYNYIYDTICDYLDNCFYGKNLCDFKDNKCGEKTNTKSTTGCCRHYKTKWLGPLSTLVQCEYLKEDYTCSAKCISCKLYTCDYLKNKGIRFKIKDILLLDVFFNPIQKYFIKYMVFTPKEKILKKLMFIL